MSVSWVFGVLSFGVQVDSVKQASLRNSLGSGHVYRCRTSAFGDHLNHCFVVLKNFQLSLTLTRKCVCDNVIHT